MAHDVFISYSAKDKTTANAVCAALESEGIRCWIAPRDVMPGMEWGRSIVEAIEQARILVLVFTSNANASSQIRREVERAANREVIIVPFRVEDVLPDKSIEYFIGNVHWLDALTPPLESHLKNLQRTVKALVTSPDGQKPGAAPAAAPIPAGSVPMMAAAAKPAAQAAGGGAAAGFHFWGRQAWTWAGGIVSVLLLGAVFIAVHSNSHSAPVGPAPGGAPQPQTAPAPAPAPNVEPTQPATNPAPQPQHQPKPGRVPTNPPSNSSPSTSSPGSYEPQLQQLMQAKNYQAAFPVAQRACNSGDMNGCNVLGLLYRNGWGVPQNYAQARALFERACDGGEMSGCGNLGYLYVNGLSVPRDVPRGKALLQRACNAGRPWSCQQLQNLH